MSTSNNNLQAAAEAHALEVLGKTQFKKNKDAAQAIASDFTAGVQWQALQAAAPAPASDEVLPALNDDLKFILGLPNFRCAPYATVLRALGQEVPTKAEEEQAAVIHWLLKFYLANPANWRDNVGTELKKAQDLQAVKGGQQDA